MTSDNPWYQAIDEALVVNCLDCIGPNETAEQALARLIQWEVQVALDPAVSKSAAALIANALAARESEKVHVEAVAMVIRSPKGIELNWLIEGGIAALESGEVLLIADTYIVDDRGTGTVRKVL